DVIIGSLDLDTSNFMDTHSDSSFQKVRLAWHLRCDREDEFDPPNDCRINCKTASHGDGDRGTPLAPYCRMDPQAACRRRAWIVLAGRKAAGKHTPFCQFLAAVRAHVINCGWGRAAFALMKHKKPFSSSSNSNAAHAKSR